jgi:uncharacterized protein YjbI with pentapeptide repeats
LGGADLSHAHLIRADLTDAYLQAKFQQANLTGAVLISVDLSGADLTMATLSGADLSKATLRGTIMSEVKYDKNTKWPDWFDPESAGCILVESQ